MNFSQWWKLALSFSGTDPLHTSSSACAIRWCCCLAVHRDPAGCSTLEGKTCHARSSRERSVQKYSQTGLKK
jgi:hypothetical protein